MNVEKLFFDCPEFVCGPTSDYGHACFVGVMMQREALCLTERAGYCSLAFNKSLLTIKKSDFHEIKFPGALSYHTHSEFKATSRLA